MENITHITDSYGEKHVMIEHADGSFTSMTKTHYEAQQAEQFTPIAINEAATK
jgi:hypothetical protein